MMGAKNPAKARETHSEDPFEGEELLLDAVFGAADAAPARALRPVRAAPAVRPEHYKVVSISLYVEDIERLNDLVRELKKRGHYKANKSQIIRHALAQIDLDRVPKSS